MNIQELFLKQTRLTEITTVFIVVKAVPSDTISQRSSQSEKHSTGT